MYNTQKYSKIVIQGKYFLLPRIYKLAMNHAEVLFLSDICNCMDKYCDRKVRLTGYLASIDRVDNTFRLIDESHEIFVDTELVEVGNILESTLIQLIGDIKISKVRINRDFFKYKIQMAI